MEPNYIGVDLHKAFFQACALTATGTRVWEARLPRSADGLAHLCARCSPATHVAVEATGPTWAFVDALAPTGASVGVVDTRKTKLKAGYAAKTDRLDARRLADALRRESVVSIYVPPPPIRELRELCRNRHQLVRLRSRVAQMIRALLLRQGAADAPMRHVYSRRGLAWLHVVPLPAEATLTVQRLARIIEMLHVEAVAADAAVTTRARGDAIAVALDRMVGIGPVLALTIRAEIGEVGRFARGAHLASYAGLVSRVEGSADHLYYGRITRQGSPWLRWALVEAAMHAMKRQDPVGKWARRLAVRKGTAKARVALARRLCDDVMKEWPRSA